MILTLAAQFPSLWKAVMKVGIPVEAELKALLRLLDDETPAVRERIAARLAETTGDLSEALAEIGWDGSDYEQELLSGILHPARRDTLYREWCVPSGGLGDDWETLEHLLRLLSDFLHDGVNLRQSLPDALDLLAEEAEEQGGALSEDELRRYLFESGRFRGNREAYYDPRNSDLAYVISEGASNPIGLCLIYMLAGRRLDLDISGVNFPGHFLCRIPTDDGPVIVDCFDGGRCHVIGDLMEQHPDLGPEQRAALHGQASPSLMLQRVLLNLASAFAGLNRDEDARLIAELRETVKR
jgi:hypothetical protein